MLLAMRLEQGVSFIFVNVSTVTTEGTSIEMPMAKAWKLGIYAHAIHLDPEEHCLGLKNLGVTKRRSAHRCAWRQSPVSGSAHG